jgi:hypothetical protein
MLVRIGDRVEAGQPLVNVFQRVSQQEQVGPELLAAIGIGEEPCSPPPLIERLPAPT